MDPSRSTFEGHPKPESYTVEFESVGDEVKQTWTPVDARGKTSGPHTARFKRVSPDGRRTSFREDSAWPLTRHR